MSRLTMKGKLTLGQKRNHVFSRLKRGDFTRISESTGYDVSHVRRVLNGESNLNETIVNEAYKRFNKRKPVNA